MIQESVKHLKVPKMSINTDGAVDLVSRKYAKHIVCFIYSFACDNCLCSVKGAEAALNMNYN